MAQGDTTITVVGNITGDPELRFTASGAAVVNFTVASTPRVLDKTTNEWKDGDALFLRTSCWREQAENIAESLSRGDRVIVVGRLRQRSYETKEGEKRTVVEVEADEVAPSLRWASARVQKARSQGQRGGQSRVERGPAANDPWAHQEPAGQRAQRPASPWAGEPPF